REAEARLLANTKSKSYLPITGSPEFARLTRQLCFGTELAEELVPRVVSLQSPGGTGALRVAADFIAKNLPTKTVWLSNPTWANHHGIFGAPGLQTQSYAYFDSAT